MPTPTANPNGSDAPRPRQYRSRRQKPCDNCRRRRVCCLRSESESEPCSLCRSRGLSCTFLSLPNPKLRRPSSNGKASRRTDQETTITAPSRPWPTQAELNGSPNSDTPGREVEGQDAARTLQFVGLSGDQDPFILQCCRTKKSREGDGIQWTYFRLNNDPRHPASFTAVPDQHLDARPNYYPADRIQSIASPHTSRLLKTYLEVVHPALPILNPHSLLNQTPPSSLLASIFALAHPYCHEAQSINPWQFMDFTSQALPIEARNAKLETVEAALLHAQRHTYVFRAPTMPGMWADVGSIVGMSHDVGLNIDAEGWDISLEEKRRRRRVWWAVFMQDKWTALTLGRPSYIHDDQFDVRELEVGDIVGDPGGSEETGLLAARTYVAGARLTVILSDILSQLYTVKGAKRLHSLEAQECLDVATGFLSRLDTWKAEYLTPLLGHDVMYDPTGNLQLAHHTVEVTLCRAVLRTPAGPQLRERSAAAASGVIDWLKNLQVNRLSAFWWIASKINFAVAGGFMIGMFLSAGSEEEASFWTRRINTYRDILKAHSLNFNVTKLASIRMDLLLRGDSDGSEALGSRRASEQAPPADQNEAHPPPQEVTGVTPMAEPVMEEFPVDPTLAFGNTYGLEWNADLDQLLSSIDYTFDR